MDTDANRLFPDFNVGLSSFNAGGTSEIDIYFAGPYHAWERGSNESFNELLRKFSTAS